MAFSGMGMRYGLQADQQVKVRSQAASDEVILDDYCLPHGVIEGKSKVDRGQTEAALSLLVWCSLAKAL